MAEYLSPGVYVEEFDSGAVPMANVSTSTAGFIGVTEKGPQGGVPVLITNYASFRRVFGGNLSENEFGEYRYLSYAVSQFFTNGGSRCYIKRVVPADAAFAHSVEEDISAPLTIYAKNPGAWGNKITITINPSSKAKTQILERIETSNDVKFRVKNASGFSAGDVIAFDDRSTKKYNKITSVDGNVLTFEELFDASVVDTGLIPAKVISSCEVDIEVKYENQVERFDSCSFNMDSSDFINQKLAKSEIVIADAKTADEIIAPFKLISGNDEGEFIISLFGGTNGTLDALSAADFVGEDNGPGERTGIQAFIDNNEVSIMAVPGVTDPQVQLTLVAHCELMTNRFAILDVPRDKKTVDDVLSHRNFFDSEFAAMYHPWVKVLDPLTKNTAAIPPSGSVAGVYARTDNSRGVHKAPANEIVSACVGLDCNYTTGEQDILNPKGVNLIRSFTGQGIRIWGARTVSSNALWRYVNVRRLFIFIEESIRTSTNWVVFEPNDQLLWLRVRRTIEIFLGDVWRTGALAGTTEDEAFFVDIGQNTMTQGDIDAGRLICVIGVAPTKPAEFVIFRITQKTSGGAE
ncbi:MAG: phage tail sheath subtilisin-like domain-containing protein [Lachnospiraceae bacterium]|nr:phage tail sheath subtilisin-like domain-containing protein [Lachnospiraceae bacterium]